LLFLASQTFVFTAAQFAAPSSEGEQQGAAEPGLKNKDLVWGWCIIYYNIKKYDERKLVGI
jgi:hypothetical protein